MSTSAKVLLGFIIGGCLVTGGCFACATFIWHNAQQDPKFREVLSGASTNPSTESTKPLPNGTPSAVTDELQWRYSESEDGMTGQRTKTALVISSNVIEFGFPYSGEQHARLILRRKRGGNNVILTIEKGQLTCGDYFSRSVSVRFDEKPARRFNVSESADHSSTVVFINNEKAFIAEVKRAKKTRIEAVVYQNGSQMFEFITTGLKWDESSKK